MESRKVHETRDRGSLRAIGMKRDDLCQHLESRTGNLRRLRDQRVGR